MRPNPSPGWRSRLAAAVVATGLAAACAGPPAGVPTPTPTPSLPTPAAATPPVIRSVTTTVTRVEVDQDVTVTAVVEDAEKTTSQLTFEWSASVGTIQGAGTTATWRLPKGTAMTPADVVISLTVVDGYQVIENGQIVSREYRVSADAAPFRVHDSVAEISKMVVTFLVDYFGNSNVSPDDCLVDFSDSCSGKDAELDDIVRNRAERLIFSAAATVERVTIDSPTMASIEAHCRWEDEELSTGLKGVAEGDCELTAVYEMQRWWLCTSRFFADTGHGSMFEQYRRRWVVPGRRGGG
ncbi:MAG: hypothetical protein R2752_14400 [Vicinamibacterales bacterium]